MDYHDLTAYSQSCAHCGTVVPLEFARAELFFREQKEMAELKITVHEDSSHEAETINKARPIDAADDPAALAIIATFNCSQCHEQTVLEVGLWRA